MLVVTSFGSLIVELVTKPMPVFRDGRSQYNFTVYNFGKEIPEDSSYTNSGVKFFAYENVKNAEEAYDRIISNYAIHLSENFDDKYADLRAGLVLENKELTKALKKKFDSLLDSESSEVLNLFKYMSKRDEDGNPIWTTSEAMVAYLNDALQTTAIRANEPISLAYAWAKVIDGVRA